MAIKCIWINCNLKKPVVYSVIHLFQINNIRSAVKGKLHPEASLHMFLLKYLSMRRDLNLYSGADYAAL